jgi:DNA primase
MIAQNVVEEVRARVDIVEIVGEHVQLKRSGKEYKARCPFHNEKTPSFYVVPSKGFYKCFGCGESGDAFSFLMKRQGLTFAEAVRVVIHVIAQQDERAVFRRMHERIPLRPVGSAIAGDPHGILWHPATGPIAGRRVAEGRPSRTRHPCASCT